MCLVDPDFGLEGQEGHGSRCRGLIHDRTLRGPKELYLLYSREYEDAIKTSNEKSDLVKFIDYVWSRLSNANSIPTPTGGRDDHRARLALFGPGIESQRTKFLVRRLVNAHNNTVNAVDFVPGQAGGIGSGVRIDLKKLYTFDLICLYTNSKRIREAEVEIDLENLRSRRLLASHNRLLVQDIPEDLNEDASPGCPWICSTVLKLLPTLDGILFSIDTTETISEAEAAPLRSELFAVLKGVAEGEGANTPLLVLSCKDKSAATDVTMNNNHVNGNNANLVHLAKILGLTDEKRLKARPWGIFEIDIATMEGIEESLLWLLYHNQKQKTQLQYHVQSATSQ